MRRSSRMAISASISAPTSVGSPCFLPGPRAATGKVIAFEPVWNTYMMMCKNIQNTINIKAPIFTMPFGLAEEEKTAIIHVPDGRFESGSLARPDESGPLDPAGKIARYECRFMSLDGFLRSRDGLVADIWKIDVEGAELFVLRGASQHFAAGNRPLIVAEVYAPWEHRLGYGPGSSSLRCSTWDTGSSSSARGD